MPVQPGDRVTWESLVHGPLVGTVADVPPLPPVDRVLVPGARIPVDLDTPLLVAVDVARTTPKTIVRYFVREQFLTRLEPAP